MKNIQKLLLLFCTLLMLGSCEEEPPYINMTPDKTIGDTTYVKLPAPTPQQRNVLIEEVTGVRCPNCPKAQLEAKTISDNNAGRIHILTIHPLNKQNALTRPFDKAIGDAHTSKYDFRTEAGAQLYDMVGLTAGLPTGNVNRKLFSGETARNIDYQKWSAYVATELAEPTPVNINLKAKNVGDSIEVEVTVTYTSAVSDTNYVSIAILESDMEDVQESKDANGNVIYVENYMHNHVLRTMVTGYYGDMLKGTYEPGRVFYKKYRVKRDTKWNAANLDVLAWINLNTTKKNVIHSQEVKVQ
jgi:hypothetical protein